MADPLKDCPYEGSDEASESELLDRSLSVWKGWSSQVQDGGDAEQFAPLHIDIYTASSIGLYDCVNSFIKRGEIDLNRKNLGGWTALMYACYIGHDNVVNLLLDAGVSVNLRNNKGQTPLMLASCCGNESVAYFLLQQEAELEAQDRKGWSALYHATYSGHQNMVNFLLDNHANMETKEPVRGMTPFLEAAAAGHEIIVHHFLQHRVNLQAKCSSGDTARSLALVNGHTKIVSLIDNHLLGPTYPLRSEPGLHLDELSSSDEALHHPRGRHRHSRAKPRGPSIREGPEAFARLMDTRAKGQKKNGSQGQASHQSHRPYVPHGYVSFEHDSSPSEVTDSDHGNSRDMISPIQPEDHNGVSHVSPANKEATDYEEESSAFSQTGALTIKSSSSSSGGLVAALGLSQQHTGSSSDDQVGQPPVPQAAPITSQHAENRAYDEAPDYKDNYGDRGEGHQSDGRYKLTGNRLTSADKANTANVLTLDARQDEETSVNPSPIQPKFTWDNKNSKLASTQEPLVNEGGRLSAGAALEQHHILAARSTTALVDILEPLGLSKYLNVFEEQDVDLQVFLSLTDNDLKEVGIKLFGPRRKMTNAIARWHSQARPASKDLEQAYTDKLEAEMQEMAIQLHQSYEQLEQARRQVLQEQELRSVAEGCLTEDRMYAQTMQSMAADAHHRCATSLQLLNSLGQAHNELCRRTDASPVHVSSPTDDTLASALREGLQLDGPRHNNNTESNSEIRHLATGQLTRAIKGIHQEILSQITIAAIVTSKLATCDDIDSAVKASSNEQPEQYL